MTKTQPAITTDTYALFFSEAIFEFFLLLVELTENYIKKLLVDWQLGSPVLAENSFKNKEKYNRQYSTGGKCDDPR